MLLFQVYFSDAGKNLKNQNQTHDVSINILRKELAEDFKYKSGITSLFLPKIYNKLRGLHQRITLQIYTSNEMHVFKKKNVRYSIANF